MQFFRVSVLPTWLPLSSGQTSIAFSKRLEHALQHFGRDGGKCITDARPHQILWPVFITEDLVLDETEDREIERRQVWGASRPSGLAVVGDDLTEQCALGAALLGPKLAEE